MVRTLARIGAALAAFACGDSTASAPAVNAASGRSTATPSPAPVASVLPTATAITTPPAVLVTGFGAKDTDWKPNPQTGRRQHWPGSGLLLQR